MNEEQETLLRMNRKMGDTSAFPDKQQNPKLVLPNKQKRNVPLFGQTQKKPVLERVATLGDSVPEFVIVFLEWFFHKECDVDDVQEQWWLLRREQAHLPLVTGVFFLVFFLMFQYVGFFKFVFRTGYVQDDFALVEGTCGACTKAVSIFDYPDEHSKDWMRALLSLASVTAEDGPRGFFEIEKHWGWEGARNVSMFHLGPIMKQESAGGCDCAVFHSIPATIFAFDGVVYFAHQFSGVRGAVTSCGMALEDDNGEFVAMDVSAASIGNVRYWNSDCNEVKTSASHALMCCANLCQLPPKNLLL